MSKYQVLDEAFQLKNPQTLFTGVTIGEVVDTNDPQQMGRLRVLCPALGDTADKKLKDIPWAMFASPFAGVNEVGTRGREEDETTGPVAYGMWNIPKVGANVLITCVDGNPRFRIWVGCVYDQYLTHTLPHGRYTYQEQDELTDEPSGPLSSTEDPIQPLHDCQTEAFGDRTNFEYRTRGADYSATYVDKEFIHTDESKVSDVADDREIEFTEDDGNTIKSNQGYAHSRVEPDLEFESTGKNYDPQTYSWTTPGFHSVSMDDRPENCRMRFRTTHGQQIILDDTNERIYISTAQGKTWIEFDEKGNIDIFASEDISFRAKGDINFTTDKSFRIHAKEGIHAYTDDEFRIHAQKDCNIRTEQNLRVHSAQNTYIQSGSSLHIKSGSTMNLESADFLHQKAGANILLTASPDIHFNGPPASSATLANEKHSYWTTRVPDHEPWGRVYTKEANADQPSGNSHVDEYQYNDIDVGRRSEERGGKDFSRNDKWHR